MKAIRQTLKDIFPTYADFETKVGVKGILNNFKSEDLLTGLLVKGAETIYEEMMKRFTGRVLRHDEQDTVGYISTIMNSTMPAFIIKTAYIDIEFQTKIKDEKERGMSLERKEDADGTTEKNEATSTTPFNENGSEWTDKDKADMKTNEKNTHNRKLDTTALTVDYIRNIGKLQSPLMRFPLMNYLNQFSNLFVEITILYEGGIY